MHLPNFLVIGAQKCGTTSLYVALKQHPQVYMSPVKEPRFFAFQDKPPQFKGPGSDLFKVDIAIEPDAYSALFRQSNGYPVRGEASPIYLSSYQPEITAKKIQDVIPDVKIIAILRQPAERAWSAFLHHRRLGLEPLRDFGEALEQENWRMEQNWYPGWRYYQNGLYAQNLMPYLDLFDRKQVKICLYEDWSERPTEVLNDIFQFLGVDPSFKLSAIPHYNKSLLPRNQFLNRMLRGHYPSWCDRFIQTIEKWNQHKPVIPGKIRRKLTRDYTPGIPELEKMLGVDLVRWK